MSLKDALLQAEALLESNSLDVLSDHLLASGSGMIELISEASEGLEAQGAKLFSILGRTRSAPSRTTRTLRRS